MAEVHGSVRRSDEVLTGLLTGTAAVAVVTMVVLALGSDISGFILVALAATSSLLRARLFPTIRHRAPLIAAGVLGLLTLFISIAWNGTASTVGYVLAPVLLVLALVILALARYFATHRPSPYVGRLADIFDVLVAIGVVPMMCLVVGLFGYLRGLYG